MDQELKIGSVVRLKSAGPPMTVTGTFKNSAGDKNMVACYWFAGTDVKHESFPVDAVEATRA